VRVALFTDSNIFYIDGVGRIIRHLIDYIERTPRHSLAVLHRGDGDRPVTDPRARVTVFGVSARYLRVPGYTAYPFFYLQNPRKRLLRMVRDFQPDILLTFTPYVPRGIGRSALYIGKRLKVPLVGSFDLNMRAVSELYARKMLRFRAITRLWDWYATQLMAGYRHCSKIFVPSRFIWDHVAAQYGAHKCVMFPRGIDIDQFSGRYRDEAFKDRIGLAGKTILLYVGRLSLEKNLTTLVDMYARLKTIHRNLALLMLGEGPQRAEIESRGLPDLVCGGTLHGLELSRAYASADVFVFPSQVDAGPMVILEAMASGVPVVVFDDGGAKDAVTHGETGLIAKSVSDFAEGVDSLVADPELRARLGAQARRRAEDHRWDRVWADFMAVLETLRS